MTPDIPNLVFSNPHFDETYGQRSWSVWPIGKKRVRRSKKPKAEIEAGISFRIKGTIMLVHPAELGRWRLGAHRDDGNGLELPQSPAAGPSTTPDPQFLKNPPITRRNWGLEGLARRLGDCRAWRDAMTDPKLVKACGISKIDPGAKRQFLTILFVINRMQLKPAHSHS